MARAGGKDRGVVEKPKKSGIWWARWYDAEGREHWKRCDSKSQARAVYERRKVAIRAKMLLPEEKRRDQLLFKAVADEYERKVDADRRRPGDDKARIEFWVSRFGKQDVETIKESAIEDALADLRAPLPDRRGRVGKQQRRSYETARRYFAVLHAILERARKKLKEHNINFTNPASDIEFKKADNVLVRYLTPDHERALLDALPARYHPIIITAIHTGMRRGELLRLTWADIDWFAGTILIRETKAGQPRHALMNSIVQRVLVELKAATKPAVPDRVFPF